MSAGCYIYVCEVDGVVRYVGRGRGARIDHHLRAVRNDKANTSRFYAGLAAAIEQASVVAFRKIVEGLAGDEARSREMEEMAKFPREQLWNTIYADHPKVSDADWIARHSAATSAAMADPERRARISASLKVLNADPDFRAKRSASTRASWANKETRKHRSEGLRRAFSKPDVRARKSAATAASWADAGSRAKRVKAVTAALATPGTKALLSAAQRERMSGYPSAGFAWWRVEQRIDRLVELRNAGWSYRAIAEALGTTKSRVAGQASQQGLARTRRA